MSIEHGKQSDYLGMTLDFIKHSTVYIQLDDFVTRLLNEGLVEIKEGLQDLPLNFPRSQRSSGEIRQRTGTYISHIFLKERKDK